MTCYANETSWKGSKLLELANDLVKISVSPSEGGKIRHLVNLATGRDYCWQMPEPPTNPRKLGMDYGDADCTGIDDCLPTIGPCQWNGRNLPDHGEIWTEQTQAQWISKTSEDVALSTSLDLPVSQMRLRRIISLAAESPLVRLKYELQSTSAEDQDFIWSLHPLMTFKATERLILPSANELVIDATSVNTPLLGLGERFAWPIAAEGLDLSRLQIGKEGEQSCVKFFSDRMQAGWAALHDIEDGDLLAFLFDPSELPYVGVWINHGGWAGYQHVAIEPSSGRPDRLDIAAGQWNSAQKLLAGQSASWELSILCTNHKGEIRDIQPDGSIT